MSYLELLKQPMPWYIAGPLIGLTIPTLLILGNKFLGVSSSLRHICAACFPGKIPYFDYKWKEERWNLFFVVGILIGGVIAGTLLSGPQPMNINPKLMNELSQYGIADSNHLLPNEIFAWKSLFTLRGFVLMVVGGFLVGFGTRYAGGCTSGHSIMGLSNLQFGSLVATICFMAGGFIMANIFLPYILRF